jgi:hypothetical protein
MIGQTIGQRALLDNQIVKNYIRSHKTKLCERLGINQQKAERQLKSMIISEESQELTRKEAVKQQRKFCRDCFE